MSSSAARGFEALHNRNYRLFWFGQLISLTGSWMQTTAHAWLVLQLSDGSPFQLGLVITVQFLPVMLFALMGGVLADRLPKRPTLMVTQSALMIQAAVFAALVLLGVIQLWQIYVLSMIQGIITAIDNPVRQAFLYEMVGRKDLVNAVGLNSMSFQGARIFGPAVAGVLIQTVGIGPSLALNALSFIPVIGALALMDPKALFPSPLAGDGSVLTKLKEGLGFAGHTPIVFSILIVSAFLGTFGFNFTVIVPLVAESVLHASAAEYGILSAAFGIGALVAALAVAYQRTITMRRLIISGTLFSILLGLVALATTYWFSLLLFVLIGMFGITSATAINSLLQLNTPEQLRGRVLSINVLLVQGSTPIGGFFLGTVGELGGVMNALLFCALLCLCGVGTAATYYWRVARGAARS